MTEWDVLIMDLHNNCKRVMKMNLYISNSAMSRAGTKELVHPPDYMYFYSTQIKLPGKLLWLVQIDILVYQ